jgi:23S rRNA (uracil1939-C5)-methyltransferase
VCGGCALQHLDSRKQILAKQEILLDALTHIGKVEPGEVLPPLRLEQPWGYRRKARLGVKYVPKKGKVLVGFRERGTPYVADLGRCEVLHPLVGERLKEIGQLIDGLSIRDRVPQIELAMGDEGCIFIFRILEPLSEADAKALLEFGQQAGIEIWTQDGGPDTVRPLSQEHSGAALRYALPDQHVTIEFRPEDFTQVNYDLNRLMVNRALELLAPQATDKVLDLFCGLGNFTLPLARNAAEVVGVEGDAGLVQRARLNAERNGIANTRYFTANLYESLEKEPWRLERFDKALLDPPRSGALEVLEHLPKLGVERIVYVSCYPSTLARDAGELVNRHGYKLLAAGVMDMFPHTAHVESIALFERG